MIVAKILSNRLRMVVEKIISKPLTLSSRVGRSLTRFSLPRSVLIVDLDMRFQVYMSIEISFCIF